MNSTTSEIKVVIYNYKGMGEDIYLLVDWAALFDLVKEAVGVLAEEKQFYFKVNKVVNLRSTSHNGTAPDFEIDFIAGQLDDEAKRYGWNLSYWFQDLTMPDTFKWPVDLLKFSADKKVFPTDLTDPEKLNVMKWILSNLWHTSGGRLKMDKKGGIVFNK